MAEPQDKNIRNKKKLFIRLTKDVKIKKEFYLKNCNKTSKILDVVDVISNGMNGTAIILTVTGIVALNPMCLVASAIIGGASFILSVLKRVMNLDKKVASYKISYMQYSELEREMLFVLTKDDITNGELDNAFKMIAQKLSLIDDSRLPIDTPEELTIENFLTISK